MYDEQTYVIISAGRKAAEKAAKSQAKKIAKQNKEAEKMRK